MGKEIATPVPVCRQRRQVVHYRIVLTAKRQCPQAITLQADVRLSAEHPFPLACSARVDVETIFQLEDRFCAAAEIFDSFEAPTAALSEPALHLEVAVTAYIVRVVDPLVDQTVQRDAGLRVRNVRNSQYANGKARLDYFIRASPFFLKCFKWMCMADSRG